MHIVQCLTHSGIGGGQQIIFTLVKALTKHYPDIRITVVLPPNGIYIERFSSLQTEVIAFPLDRLSSHNVIKIANLFQQLAPDIIHSHGKGAGFYSRIIPHSLVSAKRVYSYHGFHPPQERIKRNVYLTVEQFLLLQTDHLVMVSENEAKEIKETFSVDRSNMSVIPNVIECPQRGQGKVDSGNTTLQLFLSLNPDAFRLCIIGRNDPVKNFSLAFQTMRYLIEVRKKNVTLIVIGLSSSDIELRQMLEQYPNNIFSVEQMEDITPVLSLSDALLITSKKEGSPLVVLEAMCCGKPVVGTNVAGIKDLVTDGMNGVLCAQHHTALADGITSLMTNKPYYQYLSRNAYDVGLSMDTRVWAGQYYNVYKGLLH